MSSYKETIKEKGSWTHKDYDKWKSEQDEKKADRKRSVIEGTKSVGRETKKVVSNVATGVLQVSRGIYKEYDDKNKREPRNENVKEPWISHREYVEPETRTNTVYVKEKSRPTIHVRRPEEVLGMSFGINRTKTKIVKPTGINLPQALSGMNFGLDSKNVKLRKQKKDLTGLPPALRGVNMGLGVPQATKGVWGMDGLLNKSRGRR